MSETMKQICSTNQLNEEIADNNIPGRWKVYRLSDIVTSTRLGGNYENSKEVNENPLIKMGNIGRGNIILDSLNYISDELIDEEDRLKKGDLLFNTRNTLDLVGKVGVWNDELEKAYYNSNLLRICFDNKVISNNYFMSYCFNSEVSIKNLRRLATGTTSVAAIYTRDLLKIKMLIPPIEEQVKIVEILSTWDFLIEKQQQLIEKKKEFKKGLMQKLLSGEVRFKEFKDEWKSKCLGEYITYVNRECDKPSEGYWRLGLRSHGKGTFHEFVDDPSKVSMDKLYKVKSNDLIVNITFAWEHAIAVASLEDEGKLVSHRFPTYEFNKNAYPMYFKYYILQPKFKNNLVNISPGGAGRNRVMNKKDFLKLEVLIPGLEEQKKISEVLVSADKEIDLLEKELEVLKLQKKGLMQRLLTGEVRVKTN